MPSLRTTALLIAGLASSVTATLSVKPLKEETCQINQYSDLASVVSTCANLIFGSFEVPAGETLDLSKLRPNATATFTGTITFGYKEWKGPFVRMGGTNVTIDGAKGLFDGDGSRWWDTEGTNGGKTKPRFFINHDLPASTVQNLNIKNAPAHVFSLAGNNTIYDNIRIDMADANKLLNGKPLGHNTDAFDVGQVDGLTIQNSWISNQDDCLAINSGKNVKFLKNTCIGGHGISVGSVGNRKHDVVENVLVQGCTIDGGVLGGENGLRIKTKYDAPTGLVKNVRWLSNTLKGNIQHCIVIRQDYSNNGGVHPSDTLLPIEGVTLNGLTQEKGGNCTVAQARIHCGSCTGITFKDVQLTGPKIACTGLTVKLPGCA